MINHDKSNFIHQKILVFLFHISPYELLISWRSHVALGSSQLGAGQFEPLRRSAPEGWEWLDMLWDMYIVIYG